MRMFNKSFFSVTALLALGALGCGDSTEEPANPPVNQPDAATNGTAGGGGIGGGAMDGGIDINGCNTLPFVGSVKLCMQPNGQNGYQSCVDGVAQGVCNPIPFGGGGVDAGTGQGLDGGQRADAASPLPGAGSCSAGFECKNTMADLQAAAMFANSIRPGSVPVPPDLLGCVAAGTTTPPACTGTGMCMVGTSAGSCQQLVNASMCIAPCR